MDFHTLSRKELQSLCKKNKIPANITNVAMADALSALPQVEGLDEIMNPREGDIGTPAVQPRPACRTSTQRKLVKEPESSKVPVTPAAVPSSRRVPAVSTRRKKEVVVIDDDEGDVVAKTPAVVLSSRTRAAQSAYSTRRSVRLLGKSLSKISLVDTEDMEQTKVDNVSEEASVDAENAGASLQTESTVVSQKIDEVEVSSVIKANCESQSHDSVSEVKSTDAEDVLQAEPELNLEKVNVEAAQEDPSSNLQDSFETCVDSNETGSEQPELEESGDSVEIENNGFLGSEQVAESEEASMETSDKAIDDPLTVLVPEDAPEDVPDQEDVAVLSVEVSEEASDEIDQAIEEVSEASEEVSEEFADQAIATLSVEVPDGAMDISPEEHQVEEVSELKPAVLTEKDETSGDSEAENEVSIQSFEEEKESNEVDKVILQLSMLDVVEMKEDQNDTSKKLKVEAQVEESEERAGGEDIAADMDIAVDVESKGETKEIANETQVVPITESGLGNPNMMKENVKNIDLQSVSLRTLKKELKKKMEGKLKTDNGDAKMQEMETTRTALQALPQNL